MNNYQLNRMKMYRAVTGYLEKQENGICKMPPFRKNYDALLDCMDVITKANSVQVSSRWGASPEKKKRRKELLYLMCRMSAMLTLYAKLTGNNVLFAEVRSTPWELGRVHQAELPMVAGNLCKSAEQHLDQLGDYGITPELLESFKKAIDAYDESIPFPRSEKVNSVVATKSITESFRKADEALEMIDLLAETAKHSDPDFWRGYRIYRRLVNEGRVKMALKAQAVRKSDGSPLGRVQFTFVLLEPDRKTSKTGYTIKKKTREQGGFYILHIPPGKYGITVEKSGFKTLKLEEYIDDKSLKRLKAEMEEVTSTVAQ
ncbi:MAG TPA: carboxypeptidase-like regulatory domain-containing protein [Bacteroidales bacterium]|nr:carboxypeptidase-like regulatory domain-containing protein [Bacteroidales bacterium]